MACVNNKAPQPDQSQNGQFLSRDVSFFPFRYAIRGFPYGPRPATWCHKTVTLAWCGLPCKNRRYFFTAVADFAVMFMEFSLANRPGSQDRLVLQSTRRELHVTPYWQNKQKKMMIRNLDLDLGSL